VKQRVLSAFRVGFILAAALVQGCSGKDEPEANATPAPDHQAEIDRLTDRVDRLLVRLSILESEAATVDTESQAFDIAKTPFGPFTISAKEITPFLDGYKVKLHIGNVTSARFVGARLKVGWGVPMGALPTREFLKAQKSKDIEVMHEFPPGAFTVVEVALTPAKADEVKELSVSLKLSQLQLKR
jgi:hypothetical protein